MVLMVFSLVWLLAAIGAFLVSRSEGVAQSGRQTISRVMSGVALFLAVLFPIIGSLTTVTTKNVGIVKSFGKPVGTLDNGLHMIAPWQEVTEYDASIQTDSYASKDRCTMVRIANSSTACVENSVRWRIKQDQADDLYKNYREFDNLRESLITRELKAALNEVYVAFDPLAIMRASATESPATPAFSHDKLAVEVTDKLRVKAGNQVEIINVIISIVHLDGPTEERIKNYQMAVADTRIAEQKAKTAAKEAEANNALSASVSNNPNVLVANCQRYLDDLAAKNIVPPIGFSCWPGGSSTPVIVQPK